MEIENLEYRELFDYLLRKERPEYDNVPSHIREETYDDFLREDSISSLLDHRIISIFDNNLSKYEMVKNTKNIYLDMDGVLCEFKPCNDINILYEKGYFFNLKPREDFLKAVKGYISENQDANIYILTSYLTDSSYAYEEKSMWLEKYLPEIDTENRIFVPCGEKKTEYIERELSKNDILFDDYSNNLFDWEKAGGKGVKVVNNINDKKGTWKGAKLEERPSKESIAELISSSVNKENANKVQRKNNYDRR